MSLIKSAFTISFITLISRILGYVRDILIASKLGASDFADAFFVAFRLPNFFRQISAEGAFNNAFVPIFSGKLAEGKTNNALNFASNSLIFMIIILAIFVSILQIFMPFVIMILAPGFVDQPDKFDTTVILARILMPYLLLSSLVALLGGVLNSFEKFAAPAFTAVLFNIVMINAILFLSEYTEHLVYALSFGVIIGGIVQLLFLLSILKKSNIKLTLQRPKKNQDVSKLFKKMVPGIVGGGVTQVNLFISTLLASTISGAVSYLYYADRLVQFPLALIGIAMGTALLPKLSKSIQSGNLKDSITTQNQALFVVLFLSIPAACALFFLSRELIFLVFERGNFTKHDTIMAAQALSAYAIGLPAFVMIKIFTTGFFAHGDTKTPVKIAFACTIINVACSLFLIETFAHVGIAVALSISAWINVITLASLLLKRKMYIVERSLIGKIFKIILASITMVICLYYMQNTYAAAQQIMPIIFMIIAGLITYFATAFILRIPINFKR